MMRFIRRIAITTGVLMALASPLWAGAVTQAQYDPLEDACKSSLSSSQSAACQDKSSENPVFGENGVVTRVVSILSMVVGVLSVIMIVIGGLRYVLSAGDSNNTGAAKNTILYAVIGLVIALLAQAIVVFVISRVQ